MKNIDWDEIAEKQFKALDKEWQLEWDSLRERVQRHYLGLGRIRQLTE